MFEPGTVTYGFAKNINNPKYYKKKIYKPMNKIWKNNDAVFPKVVLLHLIKGRSLYKCLQVYFEII